MVVEVSIAAIIPVFTRLPTALDNITLSSVIVTPTIIVIIILLIIVITIILPVLLIFLTFATVATSFAARARTIENATSLNETSFNYPRL